MRRRPLPSPSMLVALAALVVALTGAAFAAVPARDGDIHFCYSRSSGAVEVVDTQRDRFPCPQNWRGFTVDSEPTALQSPDGRVRIEATNAGASMVTPSGSVRLAADGTLSVRGEKGLTITSGELLTVRSDKALSLAGKTVAVTGADRVDTVTGSASVRMAKDGAIVIDGREVQVKASGDVRIKGSKVGDN